MAKRREMSDDEFQEQWQNLPESDQRFFVALGIVIHAVHDETLHYRKLSSRAEKMLQTADRNALFSITVECIGRLFDAPALQRARSHHRYRDAGPSARRRKEEP